MKRPKDRLQRVIVIGATPSGIAATNKLGEMGIPVTLVETDANIDKKLSTEEFRLKSGIPLNFAHRPGIIRILRNSRIRCVLPARIDAIKDNHQGFSVTLTRLQTFVNPETCILCGRCVEICPVSPESDQKAIRFDGRFSLPGRPVIDKRRSPLCRENCPLGVNAQGYVALARQGKYSQALALIRENNILPGICGRICAHPCETECRRGQLDDAVSIRAIKRFLADYESQHPDKIKPPQPVEKRKEKIAVIGSGPAGLAAAAQLARFGCQVTVFEKEKMAGGLLRYGIGPHRLPRDILDIELEYIRNIGVKFVFEHPVNLSEDIKKLNKEFDAVILAAGSWKDRKLGVDGEDLDGVEGCLSFLNRFYRGEVKKLRKKVAVIGDGNAAFDLARTLSRMGADVSMVSWFEKEKIPADPEEIKGASEEGISIIDKSQVIAFEGKNGKFRKLICRHTKPGVPDKNGMAWPVIVEGSEPFALEFDKAFVSIGQIGAFTPDIGLKTTDYGYIRVDEKFHTNLSTVYAAGDAVTGPSTVVHAMSRGKAAANQVLHDICKIQVPESLTQRPSGKDFPAIPEDIPIQHRIPMPEKQSAARKDNFSEVALGLSESQIISEAGRCLQCGVCSECLQCADVCQAIGAIDHNESEQSFVEQAGVVIIADPKMAPKIKGDDVIRAYDEKSSDVYAMMVRGFAAAAQAVVMLGGASVMQKGQGVSFYQPDSALTDEKRIGVFVCKCNNSLGWLDEMDSYVNELKELKDVVHTESVMSACVPENISGIIRTVRDKGITRIVVGSCVCCSLNFVCSACTDQRSRLKNSLFNATGISRSMVVTRNIRGEALSLLHKDPAQAMSKFKGLLDRSVKTTHSLKSFISPVRNYNFTTAVIGSSEATAASAITLAKMGMDVFMFGELPGDLSEYPNIHRFENASVNKLSGSLGDFKIDIQTGDLNQSIHVGAVILGEKSRKRIGYSPQEGMPSRTIVCAMQEKNLEQIPFFYPGMTSVPGLFIADPLGIRISDRQKGGAAAVLAAAVMPRGPRKSKGHTVVIDKEVCRNCGRCVDVCPYQAITLHKNKIGGWYASVDQAFCKGCGNCISVCPSSAADSPYRSQKFFEQTLEEILLT